MRGYRLVATLASALLAMPGVAGLPKAPQPGTAPPAPLLAASPAPLLAASPAPLLAASPAAARPPFVPCPIASPPTPIAHPPKPSPPARDPNRPAVGGAGLATAGLTLPPGSPPAPRNLSATSWLVADLTSGEVLGACGPHEQSPPASVQKLLLVATVMPKLDPAQVVEVTQQDMNFERGSSAVGLLLGGHYTVETLWTGLMLNSGNDAANVLARVGGGDGGVPATLDAMNAEARHLGALDTHAVTPSGLDGPGQFTSAYDLALIARADFARDDFRRYTSTQRAQIPAQPPRDPRGFQIQNDNQLLFSYPGALGGKTGFTDLARHTYVGFAERGGRRLVVTLLDAEAVPLRGWQQGASLLDWGFSVPPGLSVGRLVAPGETDPKPKPPSDQDKPAAAAAHAKTPASVGPWSPAAIGGATAAVVAVPVLVLLAVRRRRLVRYYGKRRHWDKQ